MCTFRVRWHCESDRGEVTTASTRRAVICCDCDANRDVAAEELSSVSLPKSLNACEKSWACLYLGTHLHGGELGIIHTSFVAVRVHGTRAVFDYFPTRLREITNLVAGSRASVTSRLASALSCVVSSESTGIASPFHQPGSGTFILLPTRRPAADMAAEASAFGISSIQNAWRDSSSCGRQSMVREGSNTAQHQNRLQPNFSTTPSADVRSAGTHQALSIKNRQISVPES